MIYRARKKGKWEEHLPMEECNRCKKKIKGEHLTNTLVKWKKYRGTRNSRVGTILSEDFICKRCYTN